MLLATACLLTVAVSPESEIAALAKEAGLPSIAVSVVTSEGPMWSTYWGFKKAGESEPVDAKTVWHLGSCTKAMSAAAICREVEEGRLDLGAPLAKVYGGVAVDPFFKDVTLRHLLAHESGLAANFSWSKFKGAILDQRVQAVKEALTKPGASEVGKFEYSNLGLVVAANAAERSSGKTIEELLLGDFKSIGLGSAGFGPTGAGEAWPHRAGKPMPTWNLDNPAVMTAAGRAHMTLPDWGKYATELLKGMQGKPSALPKTYFSEIKANRLGGDFAMGWIVLQRSWAGGTVLSHSGDNTMNYCSIWVSPAKDRAIMVVTNTSGEIARKPVDSSVGVAIRHFLNSSRSW